MVTIRTGQVGPRVRPLVVSGSELVTEHVLILCPSSKGNHAKSRAWVYQMKLNIATCDSAEASEILVPSWQLQNLSLIVFRIFLHRGINRLFCCILCREFIVYYLLV